MPKILIAHSAADTYEKAEPEALARNTAITAIASFWIADRPNRIGTAWPPEEVPRRVLELKQRTILEMLGLWPFAK